MFEVADADPVVPLENLPVVLDPEDDHIDGWVYGERAAATPEVPNPPKSSRPRDRLVPGSDTLGHTARHLGPRRLAADRSRKRCPMHRRFRRRS